MEDYFFRENKAVIIQHDQVNNNVEVSPTFTSVPTANAALPTIINSLSGIPVNKEFNEFGGAVVNALIPQTKEKNLYHNNSFEVLPEKEL